MTGVLFLAFVIFTIMVTSIDVKPIGPEQSTVGFAALNKFMSGLFGLNLFWYKVTGVLGGVAIAVALGFGGFGLYQLVRGKSIRKVDDRIILLGVFYALVLVFYLFFEFVIINYRPVILSEGLEASYPSSHAMLVICIMAAAMLQFHHYLRDRKNWVLATDIGCGLIIAVTVIGRIVSGVHWFTDIIAGAILSAALICLYCWGISCAEERNQS